MSNSSGSRETVAEVNKRLNWSLVTVPLRKLSKSKTNSFSLFIIYKIEIDLPDLFHDNLCLDFLLDFTNIESPLIETAQGDILLDSGIQVLSGHGQIPR